MNKEEKQIAAAYDKGDLILETPSSELLDMLATASENTFKKDKRINIRISKRLNDRTKENRISLDKLETDS